MRSGQRVWIDNGRLRHRPGIISDIGVRTIEVFVPALGMQRAQQFKQTSLMTMGWEDFEEWTQLWEEYIDGKIYIS